MNDPLGTPDPNREPLERLIGQVLGAQPPRRAPRTLESRVMAAIARREAVPWWRSSFLHWPLLARVAFLLASAGIVKLALSGVVWLTQEVRPQPLIGAMARPLTWAERTTDSLWRIVELSQAVLQAVPSSWIYGAVAVAAILYIALIALGATAYRTLYLSK